MYNEKNLPVLKYLRWRRPLSEHPDFVRMNQKMRKAGARSFGTDAMFPFLYPERSIVPRGPKDMALIQDAVFGISRVWPELADAAGGNIEAVSTTFLKAIEASYDTFVTPGLFAELADKPLRGTLILPGGSVFCYDFVFSDPHYEESRLLYTVEGNVVRLKDGRSVVCDLVKDVNPDGNETGTYSWHDFETMTMFCPVPEKADIGSIGEILEKTGMRLEITEDLNVNVMGSVDFLIVYHLFKKYAPVDEVRAGHIPQDRGTVPDIRTSQPVRIYDCSWYTRIVRTEGFSVRGHFRLQPCGEGKRERRLIYIHEFQKHGYVRRARLELTEKETNNNY